MTGWAGHRLIRPEDVTEPIVARLSIHHDNTLLYQCARTTCDALAIIPQGALNAVIVEETDGWALLQSAKESGWAQTSRFGVLP